MASRVLSRVARKTLAGARPILRPDPIPSPAFGIGFRSLKGMPSQISKPVQQPFIVNPALQRFGISTSTPHQATAVASQAPTVQGPSKGKKASLSTAGFQKFLPYNLLFGWIEEIILDYVHHEVSRKMVLLYLRLFLIVVMKDVFLSVYDLFV